jgi:hypothetical protein
MLSKHMDELMRPSQILTEKSINEKLENSALGEKM